MRNYFEDIENLLKLILENITKDIVCAKKSLNHPCYSISLCGDKEDAKLRVKMQLRLFYI